MVLARLHVRMTFFSPFSFMASIFLSSFGATKGPFFRDRPIFSTPDVYGLPAVLSTLADDILIRKLISAGLITTGWFPPRTLGSGHPCRLTTFTTTMGVITRAHRCATHSWANTQMALATSFPKFDITMIYIANLPNGSITCLTDQTYFTRRHS